MGRKIRAVRGRRCKDWKGAEGMDGKTRFEGISSID